MKKYKRKATLYDLILESTKATVIVGVLMIIFGLFFMALTGNNEPVSRNEALVYEGTFEKYEMHKNYRTLYLEDGSSYDVYPHTVKREFEDQMRAMSKGTKLYILVNPNNDCVAEVRTEEQSLMDFVSTQKDIQSDQIGYIAIGIFVCCGGVFMIFLGICQHVNERKEEQRHGEGRKKAVTRKAETPKRCRILLEKEIKGFHICYRRVKCVNELVVNGYVYDEVRAMIEFPHRLVANVDTHAIEAGLDHSEHSYIKFDGKRIAQKKRVI